MSPRRCCRTVGNQRRRAELDVPSAARRDVARRPRPSRRQRRLRHRGRHASPPHRDHPPVSAHDDRVDQVGQLRTSEHPTAHVRGDRPLSEPDHHGPGPGQGPIHHRSRTILTLQPPEGRGSAGRGGPKARRAQETLPHAACFPGAGFGLLALRRVQQAATGRIGIEMDLRTGDDATSDRCLQTQHGLDVPVNCNGASSQRRRAASLPIESGPAWRVQRGVCSVAYPASRTRCRVPGVSYPASRPWRRWLCRRGHGPRLRRCADAEQPKEAVGRLCPHAAPGHGRPAADPAAGAALHRRREQAADEPHHHRRRRGRHQFCKRVSRACISNPGNP